MKTTPPSLARATKKGSRGQIVSGREKSSMNSTARPLVAGRIPSSPTTTRRRFGAAARTAARKLLASAHELLSKVRPLFLEQQFHRVLEAIWQVVGDADRYITEQEPWKLNKTDPARARTVLYVLAETVRHLAILVQPFMPQSVERMLDQPALPADARTFASLGEKGALKPGVALPKPEGVFPRYVEEAAQ